MINYLKLGLFALIIIALGNTINAQNKTNDTIVKKSDGIQLEEISITAIGEQKNHVKLVILLLKLMAKLLSLQENLALFKVYQVKSLIWL